MSVRFGFNVLLECLAEIFEQPDFFGQRHTAGELDDFLIISQSCLHPSKRYQLSISIRHGPQDPADLPHFRNTDFLRPG